MQLFLDILLVAVFAFIVFWGFHKGFFKSVLQFGRLVLTVVLTIIFGPRFSAWLDQKFINPPVFEKVHGKLAEMAASATADTDAFFAGLKDKYGTFVDDATLDEQAGAVGDSLDGMVEQYSTSISQSISGAVSTVLGYVLLFLAIFLILTVVIWVVSKLVKLPILKQCDKLLGLVLGLVNGFLTVSLLATLLYGILYAADNLSVYENSYVLRFLYDTHIFRFILDKVI